MLFVGWAWGGARYQARGGQPQLPFAHAWAAVRVWPVPSRYRLLAATLAARVSSDRRALNLLVTSNDLPPGWYEERELRLRMGFIHSEDRDKRARRAKLIGALRVFVDAESR